VARLAAKKKKKKKKKDGEEKERIKRVSTRKKEADQIAQPGERRSFVRRRGSREN